MITSAHGPRRRWLAPELVQTSAMDCGPATLASLLQGLGVPASYGRLREACQTGVDGTSIDALEATAQQLGLDAEQVMIPADHVLLPAAQNLPAIAVLRQPDGAPHFVVLWRCLGGRVQVMDPAAGRRWLPAAALQAQLLQHAQSVPAADWRAWAGSDEFLSPLRERLAALGLKAAEAEALIARAVADEGWFSLGALDAGVRLVQSVHAAGGVARGAACAALLQATVTDARRASDDIFGVVPARFWSATPDPQSVALGALHLVLSGAVLVRVKAVGAMPAGDAADGIAPELQAARAEAPPRPLALAWSLLRAQCRRAALALAGGMAVAAGVLVVEALLLRGLFDIAAWLGSPAQRLAGLAALVVFAALLLALERPLVAESLRLGRQLELRLRLALAAKLPRLHDRYFASRAVSDMADRGHALHQARQVPALLLGLVQAGAELALTLLGLALIAPGVWGWALATAATALLLPLLLQPLLAERDLGVRHHAAALHGLLLDTLLGAVPVRAHQAQTALRRQHEQRLVPWLQASWAQRRLLLGAEALQGLLGHGLVAAMLLLHFGQRGSVQGGDLLLVYWALKLPALGGGLGAALRQLPSQRNVLLRLMEPLAAPDEPTARAPRTTAAEPVAAARGVSLRLQGARVVAGGQTVLDEVSLSLAPGEHVAIVGASGAGKSSLVGLLLGWHHLAGGLLKVNERELTPELMASLRRVTAWVDPGVQLWNRSLLDNLLYATDDEALERLGPALDAAGLRDTVSQLPRGLATPLGEGGARLSGGQGQRVRLARAFVQTGVRLVVLDEPFRGLDRDQRAQLLQRARAWWRPSTLLCVTHDVGQTLDFDRVLVLEQGRIVEDGAPRALQARGGAYAALLAEEAQLHRQQWAGPRWRRLVLRDGRLHEEARAAMQVRS